MVFRFLKELSEKTFLFKIDIPDTPVVYVG